MAGGGSIDDSLRQFLKWAVGARMNIAVSGGTGTGKTTLLNALSCEIPHEERVITIEDSAELRFSEHPHVVRLEARPRNAEGVGEVSIRDLVINALRMRPDRIVVGECRGAEALDMLQAMNTGHDGSLTTLHANSPEDAVLRLMTMVRYAAELPVDVIERQIASAIDLGVQVSRDAAGARYVTQVVEYRFDADVGKARADVVYERLSADAQGSWLRIPQWVDGLEQGGIARSKEVKEWRQSLVCA
jgi:pilus assembly protein CpaF